LDHGQYFEFVFYDESAGLVVGRYVVNVVATLEHLWNSSRQYFSETSRWLDNLGISRQDPLDTRPQYDQGVALPANLFRVSRTGGEAELQFFYLSPNEIHRVKQSGDASSLNVLPVAAVAMPLEVQLGLLARLASMEPELRERVRRVKEAV
jgi:hypothetical protein